MFIQILNVSPLVLHSVSVLSWTFNSDPVNPETACAEKVYGLSAQSIPQDQGHRSLAGTMSLKLRSEATLSNTPVVTLTLGASKYMPI